MLRRKEKDRDEIATRIGDSSVGIITYDTEHRIGPISTDYGILFAVFSLMVIGSLMVFSASVSLSDSPKYATTETHFFIRHMISLAAALICGYVCWHIPMKVWRRCAPVLFCLGVLLLIAVFVPGVGRKINGASRWIPLGILNLQVTEV